MGTYIARRLLLMIPTLLGITLLVFSLVALAPGGIGAGLQVSGEICASHRPYCTITGSFSP
jgi:peptide/nickel transport system permease protein